MRFFTVSLLKFKSTAAHTQLPGINNLWQGTFKASHVYDVSWSNAQTLLYRFKVFRYSLSESIPMFFNILKSDFVLVPSQKTSHQ